MRLPRATGALLTLALLALLSPRGGCGSEAAVAAVLLAGRLPDQHQPLRHRRRILQAEDQRDATRDGFCAWPAECVAVAAHAPVLEVCLY